MCKNRKIGSVQVYIGMKNTSGLNGCEISGEHIPSGIMEKVGIRKVLVCSEAIYRLFDYTSRASGKLGYCKHRVILFLNNRSSLTKNWLVVAQFIAPLLHAVS